ncbi:MAG: transcriptional regulator [Thermoplasmata archaeon]|nr:transcriptional regulator [Thermoplasmata archaeon]
MTEHQILQKYGRLEESETLELKESFNQRAVETAGAFANTRGGTILVGVNEGGNVKGASITEEHLKDWANRISNASEPTLIPDVSTIDLDGRTVGVVLVKEFPLKPVAIRGRCYRRVGPINRQMTPAEISELHLHSVGMTWDMVPSPGRTIDEIDMRRVDEYLDKARRVGRRPFPEDEDPSTLLEKIDLLKDGKPTWAAMLAFGSRPPLQAKVKCGRIRGTHTIVDDFVVDAPLLKQVDEVMAYMRRVFRLSYEFTGRAERTEIWEYPLEAVREAVTNAICHRDYTSSAEIQIKIFDDELVIWNPGPLPLGMTMEKLMDPKHQSVPRNRLLAMLFYDIELIERYGSGIERILTECDRLQVPAPEFNEDEHGFQVIFRKDIYHEEYLRGMGLNERQILAVLKIRKEGSITLSKFKELVPEVSEKTLYRDLRDLVDRDIIRPEGEKKGRRYEFK